MPNKTKHKYSNPLLKENSPYLLMHAHNPVDWYPWGDEAFNKAKNENKPVIISIGYAACHWCHVMEKESFEEPEVAELMNRYFVCIKVDREERPDVDRIYMDAVQLLTGRGGWPLNAIALPDGTPFYGGTYFPKEQWMSLLTQIHDVYQNQPEKVKSQAHSLAEGIRSSGLVTLETAPADFKKEQLDDIFAAWEKLIDYQWGGVKERQKFPVPIGYRFLLKYYAMTQNKQALKAITITLDNMAMGGIYDQVGGGFARYSTDMQWKVPHFEKMLYDNSQLVSLYASAFQLTKNPLYKQVVYETLEFIERELTTPLLAGGGRGFYSSLDADSEGEEGKFYVWTQEEMKKHLGPEAGPVMEYYNVTAAGNWEHNNILYRRKSDDAFAKEKGLTVESLQKMIASAGKKLLKARSARVRPPLDDKILTAWNALMLTAYIDAYRVFDDEAFLERALENARFLQTTMLSKTGELKRVFKVGSKSAAIEAFLDDYAFTIDAFIALYKATFDEAWLTEADKLLSYALTKFFDKGSGMFYYTTGSDARLIARKMEIMDNVIPSSNSVMAMNLYTLGHYLGKDNYIDTSRRMVNNMKGKLVQGGAYFANWSLLMSHFIDEPFEVVIVGDRCIEKRKELDKHFLPNVLLLGGKKEGGLPLLKEREVKGQTTIYVCKDKTCRFPVTETKQALEQLKESGGTDAQH
ncbi:MAG: thioredoxin domain-containing protein [bacterium]|nr:thioredoxin domain-containing protein [bacterium]